MTLAAGATAFLPAPLGPSGVGIAPNLAPPQGGGSERTSTMSPPPLADLLRDLEARRRIEREEGKNSGESEVSPHLRQRLFRLLDGYREHTSIERLAKCGRVRHDLEVTGRFHDGRGRLAGLIRCKSKSCPVCLAQRRSEYAEQITRVTELWREDHGPVYMATLTIRHGWSDDLPTTAHGVREAWRKMIGGRPWKRLREKYGQWEFVVAEEVTHGANGWHPHLHVLFLPQRWLSEDEYLHVAGELYELWHTMVIRHIGEKFAPSPEHGADFRPASAGDYISKAVGLELADPGTKEGRKGGRTPTQLLAAFVEDGDEEALKLYQHFEAHMAGKKDLTWSRGLRDVREAAKSQIKQEQEMERDAAPVAFALPGKVWDLWRHQKDAHERLLKAAESGGYVAVAELMRRALGDWAALETRQLSAVRDAFRGDPATLKASAKVAAELAFEQADIPF